MRPTPHNEIVAGFADLLRDRGYVVLTEWGVGSGRVDVYGRRSNENLVAEVKVNAPGRGVRQLERYAASIAEALPGKTRKLLLVPLGRATNRLRGICSEASVELYEFDTETAELRNAA